MAFKSVALCVVLSLTFSYGAVVPLQEDALFDMVQSFLTQPDAYATSLGMSRVKRSAFDKDFKLNALGLQVQIKYKDANNELKGGHAVITIDDLQRIVKQAQSKKVVLDIDFDSGATPKDGLFTLKVKYELNHKIVEKGTFTAERKLAGGMWVSDLSIQPASANANNILPQFAIHTKSDRQTMLEGTYTCEHGNNYEIKVNRTPGKKINAVIKGNGKTYVVDGVLDQAQKVVHITVDASGVKYKVDLDFDDSGDAYALKADANLGAAGVFKVEVDGKKDMSSAGIKVLMNGRSFASMKAMGKIEKESYKYEVRYSVVGAGDGKLRFSMKGGNPKEMKVQYLPNNGLDLKLEMTRELKSDASRHLHAKVTRGGETYLEYKNDIVPKYNADSYELAVDSKFDMSEKSMLYPAFCSYACFKSRTMHSKLYVESSTPYKFSLDVDLTKDNANVLKMEINSRNNPIIFKITAPRILPKILPTGRESIEFEADHVPGKHLKIKSNTDILKSFNVVNIDGNTRRIELNGKELVKAGYSQTDNSISQTTTLPDGRKLTTTISWSSTDLKKNKVNINLDGTERKLNADLDWDVTNPSNIVMKVDAKGENARWGKYSLMRDIKISAAGSKINAAWTGTSSFANAPWPSPVTTDVKANVDIGTQHYELTVKKNVAGQNYGLTLKDGRVSLEL